MPKGFRSTSILVIVFLVLIIAGGQIFRGRNIATDTVDSLGTGTGDFFYGVFNARKLVQKIGELRIENEALQAEIEILNRAPYKTTTRYGSGIIAELHSTYPFNSQGLVTINAGSKDGVEKGMTAVIKDSLFFGQVEDVFETYSVIRTLFDPGWEVPVRIGDRRVNALMIGGRKPKLTLIEKDQLVETSDVILTTGVDFPFGLVVGKIDTVQDEPNETFKEARIVLPYIFSNIRKLTLLKQ